MASPHVRRTTGASTAAPATKTKTKTKTRAKSDAARIERFLGRYSPTIEAVLRGARERLRGHFPRGFELVFDNYNALVFGISPTEAAADAFVSVAGYPKWVTLFFLHGAALADPHRLLEGAGKQVRSIRLAAASDLDRREVKALIAQATAPFAVALRAAPTRSTIIKMEVAKRRPRRPATTAAPAAKLATKAKARGATTRRTNAVPRATRP